ncbi:hypothetical protein FJ960_16645 [Mesorhizobium sp. B2-3-11]|uniref:hypothetical protein n=1 Tax=Mesorhizobium sp. B2-3-11 TaxID=2589953 RepID=UPI00112B996D|nr:hypothetical protein [Mesorhizobium sp. B2-3-11]TPM02798.1 hypothetical protein FJ960_16645 [Mesorhizobium sp. B2-3-11]
MSMAANPMSPQEKRYLTELATEISRLYGFARQMNEMDFAASLGGEFRGMQDAGWSTQITAADVRQELETYLTRDRQLTTAEYRIVLLLYCQLAEAGGVYESIKNVMRVITAVPYNLWPFRELVRVRKQPAAIIGPNANKTFRDLADTARAIGMPRLAKLLANAFRDDIRNGIAHADYVIWSDGLRLRHRNGGNVYTISHEDVLSAVVRGIAFFDILQDHNRTAMGFYNPPKEIVGKFSGNFPMPWTVHSDPVTGTFSISGSSPGPVTTPAYLRQVEITGRLGGKVLAAFPRQGNSDDEITINGIEAAGYEPHVVSLDPNGFDDLLKQVEHHAMQDDRQTTENGLLIASPFGFVQLADSSALDDLLPTPITEVLFDEAEGASDRTG